MKEQFKKKWLPVFGLFLGLFIIGYFPVTEMIDAFRRQAVIDSLEQTVYETDTSRQEERMAQAKAWNDLITGREPEIDREDIWPYDRQLSVSGANTSFAYVVIPKLSLSMPVYHGTEDSALAAGCGHVDYTTLPIGGKGNHAAITAHSGMANMRAFDDIRDLKEGDVFGVSVLGEMRCYKVTGMEEVLPTEIKGILPVDGEDLCTLITCTPYGINTHRLLAHGKRCPVPPGFGEERMAVQDVVTNRRIWPFILAVIFAVTVLVMAFGHVKKPKKKDRQ